MPWRSMWSNVEGDAHTPVDPGDRHLQVEPDRERPAMLFTKGATSAAPSASSEITKTTRPLALYFW